MVNFTKEKVKYDIGDWQDAKKLISTLPGGEPGVLRPYEAACYYKERTHHEEAELNENSRQ